ncbi:MAG TPA: tRNA (guanosine(37)-N1)-methyltransferase TrmD [Fimbriimonadaceae bacterium]|jgi:tRNA (guanine37-N1)-methyltransferase
MLRIDFVTLFPDMVLNAARHSMLLRAEQDGIVEFAATDPRTFTTDNHRTVDDKPYGGGPGMLMIPEPLFAALNKLQLEKGTAVVVPDPTGQVYNQNHAQELSQKKRVVFLCGHYEGIDERVIEKFATHRFSMGDYVLTGGELPALTIADSVVRLLPGVLGCEGSLGIDSHSDGLLSAPQYTRPESYAELAVPEVLKSGNHGAIETWKRKKALMLTRENRPDLFCRARLERKDLELLSS